MKSKIAYVLLAQNDQMIVNSDYLPNQHLQGNILRLEMDELDGNCVLVKQFSSGLNVKLYPSELRMIAYQQDVPVMDPSRVDDVAIEEAVPVVDPLNNEEE